jgi:hypothetical protein
MGPNRSRWSSPPGTSPGLAPPGQRHQERQDRRPGDAPFRAHARKEVRIQTVITHLQGGWQQQAAVENISLGGARIRVENSVSVGDIITLSFTAPTLWDPLVLQARVAWVLSPGTGPRAAGVAFEHKATDAVFALYELMVTLGYE